MYKKITKRKVSISNDFIYLMGQVDDKWLILDKHWYEWRIYYDKKDKEIRFRSLVGNYPEHVKECARKQGIVLKKLAVKKDIL